MSSHNYDMGPRNLRVEEMLSQFLRKADAQVETLRKIKVDLGSIYQNIEHYSVTIEWLNL